MSERGFFGELLHRRVFQYLGLYIASVWLAIEMGDWLSEQFTMPERLTAYIFVVMAVLLPSVALVAWTHGAPGRDKSSTAERIFVPLNVLLAAASVFFVPERAAPPTPTPTVAQAKPAESTPALQSSQRAILFYLSNETADTPDWYAYALPMLVAEDLRRESPAFAVFTPFDSNSLIEGLNEAGFANGMRVPRSVQQQLARQRRVAYFLRGALVDAGDGTLAVRFTFHDAQTGAAAVSGEERFTGETLFAAVDRISAAISEQLELGLVEGTDVTELPVVESMSDSLEALQLYTESRVVEAIDKDRERAMALMEKAVAADPQFAEAHAVLGAFHYYQGRNDLAGQAMDAALRYDFKLSRATEFSLRANKAVLTGDYEGARDIALAWTRVEPANENAHRRVAELTVGAGLDLEVALVAFEAVRDINPMAVDTLKESAFIQRQLGDLEAAEALLQTYVEKAPEDVEGLSSLAELQAAKGDYDESLETFRQASFLDDRSIAPSTGTIAVLMRRGDFAQAEDRLGQLRQRELTEQQQLAVISTAVTLHTQLGQYEEVGRYLAEAEPIVMRIAGPLLTGLRATGPRIALPGYVTDDLDPVIEELDTFSASLQPPWTDYPAMLKASLFAAHDDAERFMENFQFVERFVSSQTGNVNLQLVADSHRALAAIYTGDRDKAVELIERALERSRVSWLAVSLSGEMAFIQADMYNMLRRAGEVDAAATGLEAIVETYPGLAYAHLRLAQAYVELGRAGKAREALDAVKSIWSEADPGLIYLDDVERLEAELEDRA